MDASPIASFSASEVSTGDAPPPFSVLTMLRIHFLQQWFGFFYPAVEEALHNVAL